GGPVGVVRTAMFPLWSGPAASPGRRVEADAHGRYRAEGGSKHRGNVEGIRKYRVNDPSEKRDRRGRRYIEQRANPCRGVAASVRRRTPILYASAQLRPARGVFHLHFKDRKRMEAGSGEHTSDTP